MDDISGDQIINVTKKATTDGRKEHAKHDRREFADYEGRDDDDDDDGADKNDIDDLEKLNGLEGEEDFEFEDEDIDGSFESAEGEDGIVEMHMNLFDFDREYTGQERFISKFPKTKTTQTSYSIGKHLVMQTSNDEQYSFVNNDCDKWPAEEVQMEDRKFRLKVKALEADPTFISDLKHMTQFTKHFLKTNPGLSIHDDDINFKGDCNVPDWNIVEHFQVKQMNNDLWANDIDWCADNSTIFATACCSLPLIPSDLRVCRNSYLWSLDRPTEPYRVLKPRFSLTTVKFNIKDYHLLLAGMSNGQTAIFDVRRKKSDTLFTRKVGHLAGKISHACWAYTRANKEFMTAGLDGMMRWWDMRSLKAPVETHSMPNNSQGSRPVGITAFDYDLSAPSLFVAGLENGLIVIVNRKAKTVEDKVQTVWQAHCGSVRTLQRHPLFPKLILSAGDCTVKLWSEELKGAPIKIMSGNKTLTSNYSIWSPSRPAMFLNIKSPGALDVWDMSQNLEVPTLEMKLSSHLLSSMAFHHSTPTMLAVGTQGPHVYVIRLAEWLSSVKGNEKVLVGTIIDREIKHIKDTLKQKELASKNPRPQSEPSETFTCYRTRLNHMTLDRLHNYPVNFGILKSKEIRHKSTTRVASKLSEGKTEMNKADIERTETEFHRLVKRWSRKIEKNMNAGADILNELSATIDRTTLKKSEKCESVQMTGESVCVTPEKHDSNIDQIMQDTFQRMKDESSERLVKLFGDMKAHLGEYEGEIEEEETEDDSVDFEETPSHISFDISNS